MATSVEDFEHIIRHQGVPELVAFLLQLPKKDVVTVRQQTLALKKELEEYHEHKLAPNQLVWERLVTPAQSEMLFVAGLATYTRKEALSRNLEAPWTTGWSSSADPAVELAPALAVLAHTRLDWLADWLLRPGNAPSYAMLRELENCELLSHLPQLTAQCVGNLLHEYNSYWNRNGTKQIDTKYLGAEILARVQTDATLLRRDLALVFDFDTEINSAATRTGPQQDRVSWLGLLPQLVASGHVERGDLLTRCLLALRRDFRRPLLTWFKDVFLALAPTPAECLARQGELVELLAHPLPLVVNFALDQLKSLWGQPGFAPAPLLQHAEALMSRQDLKTGLRTLLAGFEKLLARDPRLAPAVAPLLATAALVNPDAAVQERAAKLLASLLGAKKPVLTAAEAAYISESVGMYADVMAPAGRALLAPYLGAAPTPVPAETAPYVPLADFVPDLSDANAVVPVADWHELLFLTGAVLKHEDPSALERWLDGLLRLRGQFPDGYAQQLWPYLRQALPWLFQDKSEEERNRILRTTNDVGGPVQALLCSWFNGFTRRLVLQVTLTDQSFNRLDPLLPLEQQRLAAAEAQLGTARPLPLLSTPTHAPYWVAPAALVHKLLAYEAAGQLPAPADLVLALARTAWRADTAVALALLPQVQHPGLRALLGWFLAPATQPVALPTTLPMPAAEPPVARALLARLAKLRVSDNTPASAPEVLTEVLPWLWAVAARTRHPEAVFDQLRPLGEYPGVAAPWHPSWEIQSHSHTFKQSWNKEQPERTHTWLQLDVATEHPGQAPPSPLLLYSLHARLLQKDQYYAFALGPDFLFLSALLPNHAAPLHWHLLRTACHLTATGATERDVLLKFLQTQLGPGAVFDEPATVLLAACLTNSQAACRALAAEVLLSAMDHGRLLPAALGGALGRLLAAEYAPVQRLADALALARDMDPTTNDALAQTLEALLPALSTAPPLRNTRLLLDAYARACALAPRQLPEPVQAQLRAWSAAPSLKKPALALLV